MFVYIYRQHTSSICFRWCYESLVEANMLASQTSLQALSKPFLESQIEERLSTFIQTFYHTLNLIYT